MKPSEPWTPPGLLLGEDDIADIVVRAQSATPGPWTCRTLEPEHDTPDEKSLYFGRTRICGSPNNLRVTVMDAGTKADRDFIVCARQDVPALLAERSRLLGLLSDMAQDGQAERYAAGYAAGLAAGKRQALEDARERLNREIDYGVTVALDLLGRMLEELDHA